MIKIADNVTQLDLEKFRGICDEKIREAIETAISKAVCANGVAKEQVDKDLLATQKQIDALFKIVWWLVGIIVAESFSLALGLLYLVISTK